MSRRTRWRAPRASGPSWAPRGRRTLGGYAAEHLARKRDAREASPRWLNIAEGHVKTAVQFFGPERPLGEIRVRDVERYAAFLYEKGNGRGGTLSSGTVRNYVDSPSNLFRRAEADQLIPTNPVGRLLSRPPRTSAAPVWLESPEAAEALRFAATYRPLRPDLVSPFVYEIVSLFAYTRLRKSEGCGLERRDVNLERGAIIVRPNRWRRLKNGVSAPTVRYSRSSPSSSRLPRPARRPQGGPAVPFAVVRRGRAAAPETCVHPEPVPDA